LNRRLGAVEKGAAALVLCGVAGDYGWSLARRQARWKASAVRQFRSTKAEQQASNRVASPECVEVEPQKPERGLT